MFAIRLSEANLDKVLEFVKANESIPFHSIYKTRPIPWYFITGYVDEKGRVHPWGLLPKYVMEESFEIDFDNAETDWDQIVRKEQPA